MKKLAVLLQIVGILAVCPMYVILEIKHSANDRSEVSSDLNGSKTGNMKTGNSNLPGDKSQNASYPTTK